MTRIEAAWLEISWFVHANKLRQPHAVVTALELLEKEIGTKRMNEIMSHPITLEEPLDRKAPEGNRGGV